MLIDCKVKLQTKLLINKFRNFLRSHLSTKTNPCCVYDSVCVCIAHVKDEE